MLTPVDRRPVTQIVFQQLLSLLEHGAYTPGDQLPTEQRLMRDLGVSRPPVREALNALVAMGLAEKRQGSGYYVRSLPLHSFLTSESARFLDMRGHVADLIEARTMLEVEIVALVAKRTSDADLEPLRDWVRRAHKAVDEDAYTIWYSAEFHTILAQLSGNNVLGHLVEFLHRLSIQETENRPYHHFDAHHELAIHSQLLACLEGHDEARAREALLQHIRDSTGNPGTPSGEPGA